MYSIAKRKGQYFLLLPLVLFIVGCHLWNSNNNTQSNEAVVEARQKIAQYKEEATLLASRIKRQYEGNENTQNYIKARDLYDIAMTQNNSWVTSLKLGIANNEDLEKTQAFKDKAKSAAEASKTFREFGNSVMPKTKMVGVSYIVVSNLIGLLVENGLVIWNNYRGEQEAARVAAAERTEKELRWSRWEDIK
ncbi:hypothetical protein KFV02_06370 [Desulfohalobiaceae bacterium Ax17]|jgi:hypothetical protein|uniref:hypothetical protein n=1 Tax=Desulfovulcanus ferrireducens TaxID=2831190 RepID=UPI00207BB2EB|nr:hypothetical protein [Desulfovulcanus ferrireducens]MBT8763555.1 hypothetical protein [Desulfovulcanus ferrireducens]